MAMNDLRSMQLPSGVDNIGLADLSKFRVNPYKGYLASNGVMIGKGVNLPPGTATGPGYDDLLPIDVLQSMGMDGRVYLRYRNMTAKHETGGTFDPRQKQKKGGPGRGLFQFEPDALKTAAKRMKAYYKQSGLDIPDYINKASEGEIKDASTLTPQQQEMMFVGQMLQVDDAGENPQLNRAFKKDFNTVGDYADAWFRVHNRSSSDKAKDRKDKFTSDNKDIFDNAENIMDLSPTNFPFKPGDSGEPTPPPFPLVNSTNVPQAGLGDFFKKAGKAIGSGLKGSGDFLLSSIGMGDVIKDSYVDNSKILSGLTGVLGKVAPMALNAVAPGAGLALSSVAGAVNNAAAPGFPQQEVGGQGINMGSLFGGGQNPFGGEGNAAALMQLLPLLMGGASGQGAGGMAGLMGMLGGGFTGQGMYENGGLVERGVILPGDRAPIQAETYKGKAEAVVLPTGHIAYTNAKTSHQKMERDVITDIVADGTYVASAQPRTTLRTEQFEDIKLGYQEQIYVEGKANEMPREFTAAEVVPKGVKKFLPTEYAGFVAKHFPLAESDDIFTEAANKANLRSRIPYLATLVALGEDKKNMVEMKSNGGIANAVPRANFGDLISTAVSALPFITQAARSFNGNPTNGFGSNGLDPVNDALMLGSFPLSTLGINKNVNAQQAVLADARTGLTDLTAEQQRLNDAGTAIGVGTALAQETQLDRLNQDFSRLLNFNTATPQQFINAAARPSQDMQSLIDQLGPGAAASALANQNSQSMDARNRAASDAFSRQQQLQYGIANTVTQGQNAQEQFNNQLSQQELALRNNQTASVGGALQGNIQNQSQLASGLYQGQTQLAMQQAGLQGQKEAAIAQQMMNMASARQVFMNQSTPMAPQQPAPIPFGQGNAGGNTLGVTRNDMRSFLPPNTINVPPVTGLNPVYYVPSTGMRNDFFNYIPQNVG